MSKLTKKQVRVSLVEYATFKYIKGMEGMRAYRIEYGGHAESCIREGFIYLPADLDPEIVELLLNKEYFYNHEDYIETID